MPINTFWTCEICGAMVDVGQEWPKGWYQVRLDGVDDDNVLVYCKAECLAHSANSWAGRVRKTAWVKRDGR